MKRILLIGALTAALATAGCAGMSDTQQRAGSGALIGAGGGALIGAIAGNAPLGAAIGAGAGLVGGLVVDKGNYHLDIVSRCPHIRDAR